MIGNELILKIELFMYLSRRMLTPGTKKFASRSLQSVVSDYTGQILKPKTNNLGTVMVKFSPHVPGFAASNLRAKSN